MADVPILSRIFALSALVGDRAMTPQALTSLYFGQRPGGVPNSLPQWVSAPAASILLSLLAMGELVGDKLPTAPARTTPPALSGRAVLGAGLGALLARAYDQPVWLGALGGGSAAATNTYATYYARRELGRALHIPDFVVALAEDAAVLSTGWWLLNSLDAASKDA